MEQHKAMLKTRLMNSRNRLEINRENHRVARSKRREDSFFNNRVISVSPTPKKILSTQAQTMPRNEDATASEQENRNPQIPQTSALSRRKEYLNRFKEWRAANKQRQALEKTQIDPTTKGTQQHAAEASFVPSNRRSLYVVVDFKSKKNATQDAANPRAKVVPSTAPSAPPNLKSTFGSAVTRVNYKHTALASKPPADAVKPQVTAKKLPPSVTAKQAAPTAAAPAKQTLTDCMDSKSTGAARKAAAIATVSPIRTVAMKKPATVSAPSAAASTVASVKPTAVSRKPLSSINKVLTKPSTSASVVPATTTKKKLDPSADAAKPVNLVTQPFDKPANSVNIVKPIRGGGGAAGKFKVNANPPLRGAKNNASSNLAKRMKVKKADHPNNKQNVVGQLRQAFFGNTEDIDELPDTPLERLSVDNPFQATSTQCCKTTNASQDLLGLYRDLTKLSPLGGDDLSAGSTTHTKSSAKRQLLTAEIAQSGQEEQPKRKFDFTRYSMGEPLLETPAINRSVKADEDKGDSDEKTMTPPQDTTCKPNYLSPFVSVSRGKVNSQTERSKRNSMYLLEDEKMKPETPIAVRRTMESVQYFRLQLDNEIGRLNSLCDEWLQYSSGENEARLAETGGKDMIDAAIGQTKLLTSKKMMQFSSLIDRCEAGATGIGLRANDGSEDTKPVLAEDLEGWWDMMRLQSDNVDKRFDNLKRWKANDWVDPDEVVPKPKPKTKRKVVPKDAAAKPTSKASRDLKSFLLKANAEARKKRKQKENEESILNITPKHHLIVVRDRKSFSPARTVLRVSTGSGGRPSIGGSSRKSISGSARKSISGSARMSIGPNTLLRSAIMGAVAVQEARQQTPPPIETPRRMSILKTPGTKKQDSIARRVIFSAKKKVRHFQFAVEEGVINGDEEAQLGVEKLEDCEEDMSMEKNTSAKSSQAQTEDNTPPTPQSALRTCTLRNRKVKMRYSSDLKYD